jgi:hypothetical protein
MFLSSLQEVIEKHLKVTIEVAGLYDCLGSTMLLDLKNRLVSENQFNMSWTPSIQRLFMLVGECVRHKALHFGSCSLSFKGTSAVGG